MHLERLEIDYCFEPKTIGDETYQELVIMIGNPQGDLTFDQIQFSVPADINDPLGGTWPVTAYVKESLTQSSDPIYFRNTNMLNDSTNGKFAEIFCFLTPLEGAKKTKKRRRTTVKVTSGGGNL